MHRSIRWLVGTLASILGLGLLLVRWGLWASDSRLVVENTPPSGVVAHVLAVCRFKSGACNHLDLQLRLLTIVALPSDS